MATRLSQFARRSTENFEQFNYTSSSPCPPIDYRAIEPAEPIGFISYEPSLLVRSSDAVALCPGMCFTHAPLPVKALYNNEEVFFATTCSYSKKRKLEVLRNESR